MSACGHDRAQPELPCPYPGCSAGVDGQRLVIPVVREMDYASAAEAVTVHDVIETRKYERVCFSSGPPERRRRAYVWQPLSP